MIDIFILVCHLTTTNPPEGYLLPQTQSIECNRHYVGDYSLTLGNESCYSLSLGFAADWFHRHGHSGNTLEAFECRERQHGVRL